MTTRLKAFSKMDRKRIFIAFQRFFEREIALNYQAQTFAIIGFGRSSGKTTVIRALIKELRQRRYPVATIKHIHRRFDVANKDTELHAKAGAISVTAVSPRELAIMRYDIPPNLENALKSVSPKASFILIEGFRRSELPKILCLSNSNDIEAVKKREGIEGSIMAIIDIFGNPNLSGSLMGIPVFRLEEIPKLADLLEMHALEALGKALPGLNCGRCGYKDCLEMAKAILRKEASISQCVPLGYQETILEIYGESIPMVPFVQRLLKNTILGLISTLKGTERLEGTDPSKLRVSVKIETIE